MWSLEDMRPWPIFCSECISLHSLLSAGKGNALSPHAARFVMSPPLLKLTSCRSLISCFKLATGTQDDAGHLELQQADPGIANLFFVSFFVVVVRHAFVLIGLHISHLQRFLSCSIFFWPLLSMHTEVQLKKAERASA